MTRNEAIARIAAVLPRLSDQRVRALAEIVDRWVDEAPHVDEDVATRATIARGIAQGHHGEFATDAEVAEAFARFRK